MKTQLSSNSVIDGAIKMAMTVQATMLPAMADRPTLSPNVIHAVDELPDAPTFYGRKKILTELMHSLLQDRKRIICLTGMGGAGKTSLAAMLVHALRSSQAPQQFAAIIWRSLRNAPSFDQLASGWLAQLWGQPVNNLPDDVGARLALLFEALRQQRVLLVLDDVDAVLASGAYAGHFAPGHEAYEQFVQRMGEVDHQSALLLISREQPLHLCHLARSGHPIHMAQLGGLPTEAGQMILQERTNFGAATQGIFLADQYSGNPLALRVAAETIDQQFGGDLGAFLQIGPPILEETRAVLEQQMVRLSSAEMAVVEWLASASQPLSCLELLQALPGSRSRSQMINAVRSLERRSLLEKARHTTTVTYRLPKLVQTYIGDNCS